jgi:hypothetical protein
MEVDRWPSRQIMAAKYIAQGSSVLDIGAGAQGLRDRLPEGCTYTGIDLPEYDINAGRWPSGTWDVAVMLGVFERAAAPGGVLHRLRPMVTSVVLSYSHGGRRGKFGDWNDLSHDDIIRIATEARWDAVPVEVWPFRRPQQLWVLT